MKRNKVKKNGSSQIKHSDQEILKFLMNRLSFPHCCLSYSSYFNESCSALSTVRQLLGERRYGMTQKSHKEIREVGPECEDWK